MSDPQKETELWYEFDNYYAWTLDKYPDRRDAVYQILDWSDHKEFGSLSTEELKEYLDTESAGELVNNVKKLVPYYIDVFDRYFGKDFDRQSNVIDSFQWNTFVDYGLGKLYDPREPRSIRDRKYYVHVMDVGTYGYMRWHRFNWIASILIPDKDNSPRIGRWLYLARLVGIAAELHSRSKPRQSGVDGSKPENPPNGENITPSEIRTISDTWTNLYFDDIEKRLPQLENWDPIPAFSPPNDKDFVKVAKTDEIQPSHMKEVNLANEPICIANVDGKFYAIGNRCTHLGGNLAQGTLEGYEVVCPVHGSKFDVRTGKVTRSPANRPEPTYEVKIEDNTILIKKPKQ